MLIIRDKIVLVLRQVGFQDIFELRFGKIIRVNSKAGHHFNDVVSSMVALETISVQHVLDPWQFLIQNPSYSVPHLTMKLEVLVPSALWVKFIKNRLSGCLPELSHLFDIPNQT